MKRLCAAVLLVVAIAATGCSGGSDDPGTAPSIFNLVFFPRTFSLNAGGGAVSVNLLFNFRDAEGDVTTFVLTTPTETLQGPLIPDLEGVTTGVAGFPAIIPTIQAGEFAYTLAVLDSKGNPSNTLAFVVTVR